MEGDSKENIYGGAGTDPMGGEAGNDVFVFTAGDRGNIVCNYQDGKEPQFKLKGE